MVTPGITSNNDLLSMHKQSLDVSSISLQQLRVFVAVVECKSFTKAARELFLTQPAISMQIRRLQSLTDAPLFTREGRTLAPTEAGLTVYRSACDVLAASDTLSKDIAGLTAQHLGHVAIGTTPPYSAYVLPRLMAKFRREHPTVRLTLVQGRSADIFERLRLNQIDLAIVRWPQPLDDPYAVLLGTDETIFVESNYHPVCTAEEITLRELVQVPFIRRSVGEGSTGVLLTRLLTDAGLGPLNTVLTVTTWEGVKEAVQAGAGIALAMPAAVSSELDNEDFRRVHVTGFRDKRFVYLLTSAHRREGPQGPEFEQLASALRKEFPGHARVEAEPTQLEAQTRGV
jgi:DNA-binding transcriptional LysR family regulator